MKHKFIFLLLSMLIITSSGYSQGKEHLNSIEKECVKVFHNFMNFIKLYESNEQDITGNTAMNYILLNYLYIDRNLDSTGDKNFRNTIFRDGELDKFKRELLNFSAYFQGKSGTAFIDSLQIVPLRLSQDTFIYDRMTIFQKANTYAIYHKRNPDKTLFYMLFIPPIKDQLSEPRIWSWNLGYQYGKFMFTCPNGEEGYELIFP